MTGFMKTPYKYIAAFLGGLMLLSATPAHASDVSDISANIIASISNWPGLVSGVAYLIALLFGVWGVIKLKDHVENPGNTPLREAVIRFATGGALLGLPIIYEAMERTISGGVPAVETMQTNFFTGIMGPLAGIMGFAAVLGQDFNSILENIVQSIQDLPGLISGGAYIIGIILGVWGILKLKEHVENPGNVGLREGIIRLLVGGAFFALPTLYVAMFETFDDGGIAAALMPLVNVVLPMEAIATIGGPSNCFTAGAGTVATIVCNTMGSTVYMPAFLSVASYLAGLVLAVWALLKLRDHVISPQNTPMWDVVVRFLAGGAFFALPTIVEVAYNTITDSVLAPNLNSGFNGAVSGGGLDAMMVGFVENVFGPLLSMFSWFSFVAGMIFVIIGISRLLKSAQEGPRGPGGIGTIMTFITAGLLLSMNSVMGAFSNSMFGLGVGETQVLLAYTTGMTAVEVDHVHAVMSAILQFMIVLGYVSFIRGFFIIRGVAEGNSQASVMAGITHLLGGALAVNLGSVLNAVQATLGLVGFGVNFF